MSGVDDFERERASWKALNSGSSWIPGRPKSVDTPRFTRTSTTASAPRHWQARIHGAPQLRIRRLLAIELAPESLPRSSPLFGFLLASN